MATYQAIRTTTTSYENVCKLGRSKHAWVHWLDWFGSEVYFSSQFICFSALDNSKEIGASGSHKTIGRRPETNRNLAVSLPI